MLVLGMLIVLYYALRRKRAVDRSPDNAVSREYLEANGILYSGVALFIALLWNWIGFEFASPENTYSWLWAIIDITLPLLFFRVQCPAP